MPATSLKAGMIAAQPAANEATLVAKRTEITPAETGARSEGSQSLRDAEKWSKEGREGSPPPWVPTIFVKRLLGP